MTSRKRPIRKPFPSTQDKEDIESLLVFGYECKLFRDDEKALYIDQGRHLIPWMGDTGLLIDRYDGRGHLFDLHAYDSANVASSGQLTAEEQRVEALCDEERYLELHTDLAEKAMYEEEELKRLNQAFNEAYDAGGYAAVGFNYGDPNQGQYEEEAAEETPEDDDDEPFEVPPELQLPSDIQRPYGLKSAKIIEKTAKFVSTQGAQMEILIKTKQRDNPQFSFLEHEDPLNPFYKHVVSMIKSGRYVPKEEKPQPKRLNSQSDDNAEYLHPKLMKLMKQAPEPELDRKDFLESVKSKLPSGQLSNTVYAKLVTNMKQITTDRDSPVTTSRQAGPEKLMAAPGMNTGNYSLPELPGSQVPAHSLLPAASDNYRATQLPNTFPAAGLAAEPALPPPPGMEPVTLPSSVAASRAGLSPAADQPPPPGTEPAVDMQAEGMNGNSYLGAECTPHGTLPSDVTMPAPDIQPIIDKMAAYVAKNGPDFEAVVKNKMDERFHFLHEWHPHNKYYEYMKAAYQYELAATASARPHGLTADMEDGDGSDGDMEHCHRQHHDIGEEDQDDKEEELDYNVALEHAKLSGRSTAAAALTTVSQSKGVSFSIKVKDTDSSALTGRKIRLDDSDEEDQDGSRERREAESDPSELRTENIPLLEKSSKVERPTPNAEEMERRLAEERLKDRISNAAREKVAQASREKQLQVERKRRAAMFINMLKGGAPASTASGSTTGTSGMSTSPLGGSSRDEGSRDGTGEVMGPELLAPTDSALSSPHTSSPPASPSSAQAPPASTGPVSTAPAPLPAASSSSSRLSAHSTPASSPRARSPSRSSRSDLDRLRHGDRRKHRSPRRSRSRSPVSWRRRSPSPRRRRYRSRTPPSAYSMVRRSRSRSPMKKRSRSRSRSLTKGSKKSIHRVQPRSSDRHRRSHSKSRSSRSPGRHKDKKRKSKSPSRKHKSRSRSPSSKRSKKHKHKSKSPSMSRSSSKSRDSPSRKLLLGLPSIQEVKTPQAGEPSTKTLSLSLPHASASDSVKDDDVIVISPVKEDPASPPPPPADRPPQEAAAAAPPVEAQPSQSRSAFTSSHLPAAAPPPLPAPKSEPPPPVSEDLLTKVRAMLRASRQQILKEEGPLLD